MRVNREASSSRATAAVAATLILVGVAASARAQTGHDLVDQGIALYDDLEFERAAETLRGAASAALPKEIAREAFKHLALSYVALARDDEAKRAFSDLLDVDPEFVLPRTESPRALDLLEQVRSARPKSAAPVNITQTASPVRPLPGEAVTVSIALADPDARVAEVLIYHRRRGQDGYSSVKARARREGRFDAMIPGTLVAAPALEYYAVAAAADGTTLATDGSAQKPIAVLVEPSPPGSAPVYGRWWFWTGIGTALVAGALVAWTLADDPTTQDASVTITVDYTP